MGILRVIRSMLQKLPPGPKKAIHAVACRFGLGRWLLRRGYQESLVYLISFPKCGRTWLRLMIGKAVSLHYGLADDDEVPFLEHLAARLPGFPAIKVVHDDLPHKKRADELASDKDHYHSNKVIFLSRDVRDVLVSLYFHNKKRQTDNVPESSLTDLRTFVHSDVGSLDTIIRYFNVWAEPVSKRGLLVRYEDIHANPEQELRRVLDFLGLDAVSDETIREAVAFSDFDNMRRMEVEGRYANDMLMPGDGADPDSYKTRRGKVGGYVDYMDQELIDYVTGRMGKELCGFFGYQ